MVAVDPNRWGEYNAAQTHRGVRPLAREAVAVAGPAAGRDAVELGCGIGREARFLAEAGWRVHTYDADQSVTGHLDRLGSTLPVTHTVADLQDVTELPACDLLLACASLPFVPAERFDSLWAACLRALRPGGVLAVDLLGDRDDWAHDGVGTFLTAEQVRALAAGLEVVELREEEHDGTSFSGPKHWHTYRLVARRL